MGVRSRVPYALRAGDPAEPDRPADTPPAQVTVGLPAPDDATPAPITLATPTAGAPPSPAGHGGSAVSPPAHEAVSSPNPRAMRQAEPDAPADPLPDPAAKAAARKPLLASEALMDDLAPVEPAGSAARAWCAGVGGAFLVFGSLPLLDLLPGGTGAALPWFVTGAIALVASITRVTYRQRAVAMVVLGLLSGVVALPAALLFRARYRAYAGARVFLGSALAISVPFGAHTVMSLLGDFGLAQAGAVAALFVLAGSFIGFMGAETTGAGTYMAPATVSVLALELALRGLGTDSGAPRSVLGAGTGAIAFGGASALASLGVFQILAWRFAADARRIDLHSRPRESEPGDDRDHASDWSTRD